MYYAIHKTRGEETKVNIIVTRGYYCSNGIVCVTNITMSKTGVVVE